MAGQEDVEQFLWDLERELAHLDGEERQELVKEAEDQLHEVATAIAESEGAERVRWFHYVQATAELGPPDRLAADLTGEPLPDREGRHAKLWAAAAVLVVGVVGMVAFAWFTTGSLVPVGEWDGQAEDLTERREIAFDVDPEADSVFLSLTFRPVDEGASATITVLDGDADLVFQTEATVENQVETSEFIDGEPGGWTIVIDFEGYNGAWRIEAQQEID